MVHGQSRSDSDSQVPEPSILLFMCPFAYNVNHQLFLGTSYVPNTILSGLQVAFSFNSHCYEILFSSFIYLFTYFDKWENEGTEKRGKFPRSHI